MFVSLGFGLVAAIGISQVMGRSGGKGGEIRTSPILVAQKFIDINAELTEDMISVEEWPVNIIPENAARSLDQLANMVPIRGIPKGAPIFLSDIVDKSKSGVIAIKRGQRLISIKVGADDTLNGLLKPGDRVDLIGIFSKKEGMNTSTISSTFQKNIQVYSVNETTTADGPREAVGAKANSIVTVVVNEKQAEQIALVQKVAFLKLVYRGQISSDDDENEIAEEGEPLPSFLFGNQEESQTSNSQEANWAPAPVQEDLMPKIMADVFAPAEERPFVMTVWDGMNNTKYKFRKDGTLVDPESEQNDRPKTKTPSDFNPNADRYDELNGENLPESDSLPVNSGF